jgi:hypothetical protein
MKHCVVALYKDCSNYSPGVKIGPGPGAIGFSFMYIVKTLQDVLA